MFQVCKEFTRKSPKFMKCAELVKLPHHPETTIVPPIIHRQLTVPGFCLERFCQNGRPVKYQQNKIPLDKLLSLLDVQKTEILSMQLWEERILWNFHSSYKVFILKVKLEDVSILIGSTRTSYYGPTSHFGHILISTDFSHLLRTGKSLLQKDPMANITSIIT